MNKDASTTTLDTPAPVFHPAWCSPRLCDLSDIDHARGTFGVHTSQTFVFGDDDGDASVWINQTLGFDGRPAPDEPEPRICIDGSASLSPAEARELAETLTSLASELEPLNVDAGVA